MATTTETVTRKPITKSAAFKEHEKLRVRAWRARKRAAAGNPKGKRRKVK